jgi:hypothetical protein
LLNEACPHIPNASIKFAIGEVKVAKNRPVAILVDQPDNASVADELEAITAQIGSCDSPAFKIPPF